MGWRGGLGLRISSFEDHRDHDGYDGSCASVLDGDDDDGDDGDGDDGDGDDGEDDHES